MGGRPPRNARRRAGQPATRDPIAARRAVAARYVPHRVRPARRNQDLPAARAARVPLRAGRRRMGVGRPAAVAAAIPSDQQLRLASPPDRREHRRDPAAAAEPAGRVRATTRGRQHPGDHGALGCTRTAGQRTIHRTLWRRVVHQQRPVPRPPRRLGRVGRQLLRRDRRRDAAALAPAAAAAFAAGVLAHAARRARPSADARARLAALRPGTRDARRATRRRPATRRLVHALLRVRRAGQPVHRVVAGQQRRRTGRPPTAYGQLDDSPHRLPWETDPGTTRPRPPACRCRRFPTGRCRFAYSTRSARPACAAGICRCASGIATT